jgi:hypothetical protein
MARMEKPGSNASMVIPMVPSILAEPDQETASQAVKVA